LAQQQLQRLDEQRGLVTRVQLRLRDEFEQRVARTVEVDK
jgi:hypothetical protein